MRRPIGCGPFAEGDPNVLLGIHLAAKTYGRMPHEILELDPWQIGFAMLCYQQAEATTGELVERLNRDGMPVFPVVVLKGG